MIANSIDWCIFVVYKSNKTPIKMENTMKIKLIGAKVANLEGKIGIWNAENRTMLIGRTLYVINDYTVNGLLFDFVNILTDEFSTTPRGYRGFTLYKLKDGQKQRLGWRCFADFEIIN